MMKYISFIDILGTKNSSENENFEDYLTSISKFQYILVSQSFILKSCGRVHFFSDCAYIESRDATKLIKYLIRLRAELLESQIYIRGAVIKGALGAASGLEEETAFQAMYKDKQLTSNYAKIRGILRDNAEVAHGTMFFSRDLSRAYFHENCLKAASIFIEEAICAEIDADKYVARSGYIQDMSKLNYVGFFDIKYENEYITEEFLDNIFHQYTLANFSDVSYGRYYLSILVTCINSTDFSLLSYDDQIHQYHHQPFIFEYIIHLRKKFSTLYNYAKGLEFLYFKLVDKIYIDFGESNITTKNVLLNVLQNKKFLSKYQNKLSVISKDVISGRAKNLLLRDYNILLKEKKV